MEPAISVILGMVYLELYEYILVVYSLIRKPCYQNHIPSTSLLLQLSNKVIVLQYALFSSVVIKAAFHSPCVTNFETNE